MWGLQCCLRREEVCSVYQVSVGECGESQAGDRVTLQGTLVTVQTKVRRKSYWTCTLKTGPELGVVAHTYNPRKQRYKGSWFQASPDKKFPMPHLNQ
jgi:hypothetical protein